MDDIATMVADPRLWAGLNRPDLPPTEADVVMFGVPWDGNASFRKGAREAPRVLRSITYTAPPTTEDFDSLAGMRIRDLGDLDMSDPGRIEGAVAGLVSAGVFFIMVGGDHSVTIPALRGVDRAIDGSLGIVHVDAHFDLCDAMDVNRWSHGCVERRSLELASVRGAGAITFVGVRSAETEELDFIASNPVRVYSAKDVDRLGAARVAGETVAAMAGFDAVYLTVDIDCLDPAYAGGTGTPQFGGLTARQLLDLLEGLFRLNVIGMDVVEVAPSLDDSLASVFAARKIVTECWGHVRRARGGNLRGRG